MIINVRGTSGSGKSWVIRQVMQSLSSSGAAGWVKCFQEERKQPLYYYRYLTSLWKQITVLGHYESPCGGCDTIGSARQVYDLIKLLGAPISDIMLCEGLLLSEDTKWTLQLPKEQLRVIFLETPLETCLEQIKSRREAVGNSKPLNEKNTSNRVVVISRARVKLLDAGVWCRRASAKQAVNLVLDLIRERTR